MKDYSRLFWRFALVGALAASLSLAACGRKGPLDVPPGTASSLAGDQTAPAPTRPGTQVPLGPDGKPLAPGGVNRRIPLDVLLN